MPRLAADEEKADYLFVLTLLFTKYSSAALFGKEFNSENISPAALRRYAVALLNKIEQLSPGKIKNINTYKESLFKGDCTNTLYEDMKKAIKNTPNHRDTLKIIFENLIPPAWQ